MTIEPKICDDTEKLAETVAAEWVSRMAASSGPFRVALSGGSTPRRLFEIVAQRHRDAVPWKRVHLFWGDERCVPPAHPQNNYAMARDALIDRVPLPQTNVHRMPAELMPPRAGADMYTSMLAEQFKPPPGGLPEFDLLLQGMGEDGHTASLFPGHPAVQERDRWVVDVHAEQVDPPWRISLTLPVLSHAKDVWFVVGGGRQAAPFKQIFADPAGAAAHYPAAQLHVMSRRCTWYTCR